MSKNKAFGKVMEEQKKSLVDGADIHKETHHIGFKLDSFPDGISKDSLKTHVDFINQTGLTVEAATSEIAATLYPETKQESWDGRLELCDGVVVSSNVSLRQTVGEETVYGVSDTYIDHPHSTELVNWYESYQAGNVERAENLFK